MTATSVISPSPELVGLQRQLPGRVLAPGDEGYASARRGWNLSANHRPALVVMAESAYDVYRAVRFARSTGLGVGVMGTGHGTGQECDGLLLNTSRMREVQIDATNRLARVAAGATWDDVVGAAGAYGLAALPGSSTTVGVVGYTLGGGFGWLGRRYGLAAQSVVRAEVVTADGEIVEASTCANPDLFWGLTGGTGNFGVVTSLEFALYPVDRVYAGNLYYPLERARDVAEFYAGWTRSVPDELTSALTFPRFPPRPSIPEPLRGRSLVAVRGCFCGPTADGRKLVDEARNALGPALLDTFADIPAAALAGVSLDPREPLPVRNHTELLDDLTPRAIDVLLELAGPDSASPLVMLEVRQLGGALAGHPDALSPMAHSRARYSLNAIGMIPNPTQAAIVATHLAKLASRIRADATGETYLNFVDLDGATPDRVRAAYSERDWDRLTRLKTAWDPGNMFRFNRNIPTHLHRK
jgi:hypothetical protein